MELYLTRSEVSPELISKLVETAKSIMPNVWTKIRVIDCPRELRTNRSNIVFETYMDLDPEIESGGFPMYSYSKPFMDHIGLNINL